MPFPRLTELPASQATPAGSVHGPTSKRILIDGQEGTEGRALMTMSALHLCAPALRRHALDVVSCDDPAVMVAAALLAADEHLDVTCFRSEESAARWDGAGLYISTRYRDADAVACRLAERHHVVPLVALQFPPEPLFGLPLMRRVRAAHDPALLARIIQAFLSHEGRDAG
jgi:hypothetical protein